MSGKGKDAGPQHPCEAGDGQYFRAKFCNADNVSRAERDRWAVIPIMAAHNLRDGNDHHRQNRHPHAPAQRHLNDVLVGPSTASELTALAHGMLTSIDKAPPQWNSVMCWEFLVKPPAEWDRPGYWGAALEFFATDQASTGMLVLSCIVHRDQGAAHAHVMVLPIRDGALVSRRNVNPMAMRVRFASFMHDKLGIREAPEQRRKKAAAKKLKTLGDLAATTGKGAQTRAAAAARDSALMSGIDPETGELKPHRFPLFAVPGFDLAAGWVPNGGRPSTGAACGDIHSGGIHTGASGWPMKWPAKWPVCMTPVTTWGVLSPLPTASQNAPGFACEPATVPVLACEDAPAHERPETSEVLALPNESTAASDLTPIERLKTAPGPLPEATAARIEQMRLRAVERANTALGRGMAQAERNRVNYPYEQAKRVLGRGGRPDMRKLYDIAHAAACDLVAIAKTPTAQIKSRRVKAAAKTRALDRLARAELAVHAP